MINDKQGILKTILLALVVGIASFFCVAWVLGPIFSGRIILPQSFVFAGLKIHLYGAIISLAVLSGYWLAMKRRNRYGVKKDDAESLIIIALVVGFVGARLYHVVSEFTFYLQHPIQIFEIWKGGLSIYGAALGGILAVYFFVKFYKKYSFLQILDWLTPSVVLGQIIGRFGNFANYELYGTPTKLFWKMFIPVQFRVPPYELNQFFHPLFLYEIAGSLVILVLLLRLRLKTGYLFLLWLFLYNILRFFLEQLRVESVIYGNIRVNALVSLVLVLGALYFSYKLWNSKQNDQSDPHCH